MQWVLPNHCTELDAKKDLKGYDTKLVDSLEASATELVDGEEAESTSEDRDTSIANTTDHVADSKELLVQTQERLKRSNKAPMVAVEAPPQQTWDSLLTIVA